MGVEVVGFEMAQPPVEFEAGRDSSLVHEKENGKLNSELVINEPIKFGSHGDEPIKVVAKTNVTASDTPKDAVDEWPAPKQIHTFYFVKYRSYDDAKLKAKLDLADKEIQKKNQARFQITEGLKAKRSDRAKVISQLKALTSEDKQFRGVIDEKRKEMEPLHQALGKLRGARGERGVVCSSEEELDSLIHSLHYRMQHESIPLSEEKKLLKDIKQLEQTRDKVLANVAMRTKIQDSLGQKESIQDQVKVIGGDLDGVRKEHQTLRGKIKLLEEELRVIDNDINSLQEELGAVSEKRDKAYESLQHLRKQRDEGNAHFYQNRMLLNNARDLASKRDVKGLEELSNAEVEKFMSSWSSSKGFRDDYEKRILGSLDYRQLSRDGRMRNPDEKPLVVLEAAAAPAPPVQTEILPKATAKRPKEDSKPIPQHDTPSNQKIKEEVIKKPKDSGITLEEDKETIISEPPKASSTKIEVDETKLKEAKLQEEKEKAKLALERKKKLAEKSAAKAAIRAQKEAEKKLKNLEKKAKKKAAASGPGLDSEESTEAVSEVAEAEKTDATVEAPVPSKNKEQKESVRYRNRSKGPESLPKAILKRKKSTNYWMWAAPAALVVLILLALIGYRFLL